jgi:hypothetical protein
MKVTVRVRPHVPHSPAFWVGVVLVGLLVSGVTMGQLQQSGGGGSTTTLLAGSAVAGKFGIDQTTPGTTNGVQINAALPAGTNVIGHVITDSGTITAVTAVTAITNALPAGTNLLGQTISIPAGCSGSGTALVNHNTVAVATGAGTSVSSVTGCVVECYVNNITNSAVTFRLADKAGTPVIWVGGNGDFSIPANSNLGCGANGGLEIGGIVMASGITAIAGTAAALNLHVVTRE